MAKIKKRVYVNELIPGMIATKEIRTNGNILIGKGVTITEFAIKKLKENYIENQIDVYYAESKYEYKEISELHIRKTVKQVKKSEENYTANQTQDNTSKINNEYKEISEDQPTKTVKQVELSFNEIAFDIRKVFIDMDKLKVSGIDEIRKFATRIQDELKHVSAVVKNIVLYGSGSDIIYRHGVNVAALSTLLGKWIGLDGAQLNLLTYAAVMHDFGKIKIDKSILDKPDTLTPTEFKEVKTHSAIGYNYIKEVPFLSKSVSQGVLMHHERLDGSGYPLGLKEDKIHQFAKIIAIADIFDAINSDRIYKKRRTPFEALEIIKRESLGKLDFNYCNIFLNHVINYYVGETVILNDKRKCKIILINLNDLMRPLLMDDSGFIDLKDHKELIIEELVQ